MYMLVVYGNEYRTVLVHAICLQESAAPSRAGGCILYHLKWVVNFGGNTWETKGCLWIFWVSNHSVRAVLGQKQCWRYLKHKSWPKLIKSRSRDISFTVKFQSSCLHPALFCYFQTRDSVLQEWGAISCPHSFLRFPAKPWAIPLYICISVFLFSWGTPFQKCLTHTGIQFSTFFWDGKMLQVAFTSQSHDKGRVTSLQEVPESCCGFRESLG